MLPGRGRYRAATVREQSPALTTVGSLPYTGSMSTVDNPRERLEFLQGTLEVLILRSLQLGPNHAYGITQFLEQQSGDEFLVDNGSLYPALQRLLQRSWIAAQWKMSPNGHPRLARHPSRRHGQTASRVIPL